MAYMKGAPHYNLQMYKLLVNEITTTFQNISKDILAIEMLFRHSNREDLSNSIKKIQEHEQKKLELVIL